MTCRNHYLSQKRFNPRSQRAARNVTQNVAEEVAVGVWRSNIFVTTFCVFCGQSFQPESGCIKNSWSFLSSRIFITAIVHKGDRRAYFVTMRWTDSWNLCMARSETFLVIYCLPCLYITPKCSPLYNLDCVQRTTVPMAFDIHLTTFPAQPWGGVSGVGYCEGQFYLSLFKIRTSFVVYV